MTSLANATSLVTGVKLSAPDSRGNCAPDALNVRHSPHLMDGRALVVPGESYERDFCVYHSSAERDDLGREDAQNETLGVPYANICSVCDII